MTRRRWFVPVIALVQVLLLAVGAVAATERWLSLPLSDDGMYVLLVLGSDQGPPNSGSVLDGRSDAIHIVVLAEDRQRVSIISIPRDSYVPVRGYGTTKINAMLTKGPENAVGTIEDLTGLHVDDWIVTGFDAVIKGVDEFGGVHVDVEQRLKDAASQTDLQPGYQQLSGWFTLAYSRDRHSRPDGDIGRSTGQAKVLMGMVEDLQDRANSPARLVDFASILRRYTVTSISNEKLFRLALIALRLDPSDIVNVTLPGTVGTAGAASVYRLSDQAFSIFEDVRTDGVLNELETGAAGGG